ncbi:unnamed protein product [Cyclocybe aegerita]|uniref:Uncharacterized protein n=1 Tax=Cyclocybe aegerita TaxID=1973307 RepID=A0A8S0VT25_CYCAE|nr:unnamed protein product [Cyclocybe aegerita]
MADEAAGVALPSKASKGKRPADSEARRPSQDRPSKIAGARGNSQAGPSLSLPRKDSDSRSESGAESTSHHQIWYPPQAAYADEDPEEEAQANLTIKPSVQASEPPKDASATPNEAQRLIEQQQLDEWRQYPPFPSAYPPTPITTTARLIPSSMALPSSLYPPIEEEMAQQDFRQSLLPQREPLNPTHARDSSDRDTTNFGIYHYLANQQLAKDTDDSISTSDDYEDEDEDAFNVTLRTPLPPQGSVRSQIHSRRFVSMISASSVASVPSRSSALTTVDSLRTQTSSDSSSAPGPAMLSSTVIGKKRSYPKTRPLSTKNRVRQVEDEGSEEEPEDLSDSERPKTTSAPRLPPPTRKLTSDTLRPLASASDTADDALAPSSVSSRSDTEDQAAEEREEQEEHDPAIPPEEKRRKVVRSQHLRAVTASRPVRPRVARYASPPPKQPLKLRPTESSAAARSKRGAVRSKAGSSANTQAKTKEKPISSSGASSPASMSAGAPHGASTKPASGTTSRRK